MEGATAAGGSLLCCVWRTKLYVLLLSCFFFSMGVCIILPALPDLATNFFASKHAGRAIDCEDYSLDEQPAACQAAHADVVGWASLNSLVANTFLGFFFAPLVGDLSDRLGRKPFMVAGAALAALPIGAVWLHLTWHTSFLWYYPLNALTAVVAPIITYLSYTADVLQPELRTAGFGLVTASFSIGYMIGPMTGSLLGPSRGAVAALACMMVSLLLVALALPESYPPNKAAPAPARPLPSAPSGTAAGAVVLGPSPAALATAAGRRRRPLDVFRSMGRSWALINSSSLFRRLALCMAVVGIVSEGIQDMLLQYLQLVMGFNANDQAVLITAVGAGTFVVQALMLPYLTKWMGERNLLVFGLLFSITEQALLSLSAVKWQAVAAVSLSALAGVSFPAISSLKSTHASAAQQGLVQGALAGIRAVASGLGPIGLAQLFAMSTTAEATFGYKPSIVFWTTCALTVVAAAVAASIPDSAAKAPAAGASGSAAADFNGTVGFDAGSGCHNCGCRAAGVPVDEEAGHCCCCTCCKCSCQHAAGYPGYVPPHLQDAAGAADKGQQGSDASAVLLVVAEPPASDAESCISSSEQLPLIEDPQQGCRLVRQLSQGDSPGSPATPGSCGAWTAAAPPPGDGSEASSSGGSSASSSRSSSPRDPPHGRSQGLLQPLLSRPVEAGCTPVVAAAAQPSSREGWYGGY